MIYPVKKNILRVSLFGVACVAALLLCAPPGIAQKRIPQQQTPQQRAAQDWFDKGYGLHMAEKYQQSAEAYSKAIELNPKYAAAYCGRGLAYGGLGGHERAIEDFGKALKLNPKFAAAYYYRGKSYATLGDNKRAVMDFKRAARLGEQNARKLLTADSIPW